MRSTILPTNREETPRYNGRDTAIIRAQHADACVVLGSATPSLESRFNAERSKYTLIALPERIQQRPMPRVDLIDMRVEFLETRKPTTFSRALLDALTERLASGEQTMLLLNRRGFFELRGMPVMRTSHRMPETVPLR